MMRHYYWFPQPIPLDPQRVTGKQRFAMHHGRFTLTAMPKLLTNGHMTPKGQMLEIFERTTNKTWQKDAKQVRELVAAL